MLVRGWLLKRKTREGRGCPLSSHVYWIGELSLFGNRTSCSSSFSNRSSAGGEREGRRERGREGGRDGGREGWREGGREQLGSMISGISLGQGGQY